MLYPFHTFRRTISLLLVITITSLIWLQSPFAAPTVGEQAPDFTLKDQTGKVHNLKQYRGKLVVLEWTNPTCPFVVRHYERDTMTKLAAAHPDVVWLTVNSSYYTTDADNTTWAKQEGVEVVLNDARGRIGQAYGAKTTPHMYIIDPQGRLVYQGAIDDNPHFDDRKTLNFVDQALKELKAGKAVSQSSTRPYGCSVKYKR